MSETVEGGDSTVVTQNGVTVERHLERKGDGIIVTIDLSADVRGPAEVDLVDEFPPGLPVEQAGFNVDHEPDEGDVTLERVELHHTIEAATETVVYAIRLEEPADDVAFDPPTIRDVTLPGIPEPDVPADDDSVGDETQPDTPAGEESGGSGATGDPEGPEEPADDGAARSGGGGLPDGLSLEDSGPEPADDGTGASADAEASLDGLETDDGDDVDPIESALERAEADGDGLGDQANGREPSREPTSGGAGPDAGAAGDRMRHDGAAGGPPRSETAAGPADAPEEGTVPRSVKLKLDRLNARVEEFAAYAEALEGIIDRHGTVPEILDDIEADLDDADDRLADLREEIDTLDDRHASEIGDVRERVDALEERFQDARREVASEVDDVRDDVDAVREEMADVDAVRDELRDVRSEVAALEERVSDHEDDVADLGRTVDAVSSEVSDVSRNVEAMRSELQGLQDDVDRLLRFREILADVFGGPVSRATEEGDPFGDLGGQGRDADRSGRGGGPGEADTAGAEDRSGDADAGADGDADAGGRSFSPGSSG